MTDVLVKEVKCESLGGFMILSSPFMDDEEDFLNWTSNLTYSTDDFADAAVQPTQPNNSQDANTGSGTFASIIKINISYRFKIK